MIYEEQLKEKNEKVFQLRSLHINKLFSKVLLRTRCFRALKAV